MDERRRFGRRGVDLDVSLTFESLRYKLRAQQLSEHGMLGGPVRDPAALLTKHVDLSFFLPDAQLGQRRVDVKGRVAYVTDTSIGIRFDSVAENAKGALREFIRGGRRQAGHS